MNKSWTQQNGFACYVRMTSLKPLHLKVDEDSRPLLTINVHTSVYPNNCLHFIVKSNSPSFDNKWTYWLLNWVLLLRTSTQYIKDDTTSDRINFMPDGQEDRCVYAWLMFHSSDALCRDRLTFIVFVLCVSLVTSFLCSLKCAVLSCSTKP